MDTPAKRLKWARENRSPYKEHATDAARAYGWKVSTYLGHENGDRVPGRASAKKYAARYRVPWEWILEGPAREPIERDTLQRTVSGYIGAGQEIEPLDGNLNDQIELPPPDAIGVIVRGNSMYPRYFDGEALLYLPEQRAPSELIGRECAVKIRDGGIVVKTIRRGNKRNRYTLESWNAPPLEDKAIEWASPIRWRA